MASFFSTTSGVAVVDTRTRPGTITLPLTTQIPNRYLQIKDIYGAFGQSSLTVSTQGGERFDDGTTTKILTDPFSFFTLYAASTTRWAQLGGTQTIQQTMSSLIVSSITIGSGFGWLQLPPIQTIYASTVVTQAQALYSLSSYFGGTSTATTLEYWGLFGNYNNTVLGEVSTGGGIQELLLFKGSSTSDRVRVQTTGTFVVETGVSARLWNDNTTATLSNATPAFIINTSSNVGIQTASPGAALDVAGTARAVTLSSQQLFLSSVNGGLPLSLANLTSTTAGITTAYQQSGFLSTPVLVSTVTGLGSANYVSTLSLTSSLVSTTGRLQSNISNWAQYIATSDVSIDTTYGIRPVDPSQALQLKADFVSIVGNVGGYGSLSLGEAIIFQTSTTLETYGIGFSAIPTGTISSMFIFHGDGVTSEAGSLYISSLYLGNFGGTVAGQLTIDDTATNLFWNGSQLNNQGGGGGGGAIAYVSAFTVSTNQLQVSSLLSYLVGEPITVPANTTFTGKITNKDELIGAGNINITGSIRGRSELVVSTIGNDPVFLTLSDLGLKYVMTTSNFSNGLYLPDPAVVGSGWNVLLYNNFTSAGAIDVYDYASNLLFSMATGSYYPFTTDGTNFYPF